MSHDSFNLRPLNESTSALPSFGKRCDTKRATHRDGEIVYLELKQAIFDSHQGSAASEDISRMATLQSHIVFKSIKKIQYPMRMSLFDTHL